MLNVLKNYKYNFAKQKMGKVSLMCIAFKMKREKLEKAQKWYLLKLHIEDKNVLNDDRTIGSETNYGFIYQKIPQ